MRHPTHARIVAAMAVALALCASGRAPAGDDSLRDKIRGMEPQERVDFLRALLEEGSADATVHFQLGNAYYSLGRADSAVNCFHRATTIDTSYSQAWVNLGIAYDAMRQHSAARQAYQAAIRANPEDVLAHCHLGQNHFERGEVDEAVRLYLKALAIDPASAQAHYNLGLAFAESKLFSEALAEWRIVIELDPSGDLGRVATENVELIQTYLDLDQ